MSRRDGRRAERDKWLVGVRRVEVTEQVDRNKDGASGELISREKEVKMS